MRVHHSEITPWENGTPADLNDLIPPDSGWELQIAVGVNNVGEIVGFGLKNGLRRAFLLRPGVVYYGLGDSVASGHGLPGEVGDCRRAPGAYPQLVASFLSDIGVEIKHFACSGATSFDLGGEVIDQVQDVLNDLSLERQHQPTLDALVSITIGANDFPWTDLNALGQLLCDSPSTFLASVNATTSAVRVNVERGIQRLIAEDGVFVVLTDYHNPFNTRSWILRPLLFRKDCRTQRMSLEALYARTEFAVHSLNSALGQAAASFGADRVRFASIHTAFHGRESPRPNCGTALPREQDTWIQFPLEKATKGDDCFHPNPSGAQAFAVVVQAIARQLLIPSAP